MSNYADIQPELDDFENAVYGEEVRDSMVSAIKKIHDVAEKSAGAPDATTASAGQAPVADGAGGWAWGDVETGDSIPTSVRQAILALFQNGVYTRDDMSDEVAVIQSWATEVTDITLNRTSLSFGSVQAVILQATTVPSGASVIWTTSDASVATVDNGVVTPVGNGQCTISASAGSKRVTCAVSVSAFASVTGISATYDNTGITLGTNSSLSDIVGGLTVTANYSDGSSTILSNNQYVLSGSLNVGDNTIVVAYSGFSTSIIVPVEYLYVIKESQFARKTGLGSGNQGWYYSTTLATSPKRLSYIDFDILLDGGKTYEFTATSTYDTAGMGMPMYNEAFYNDAVEDIMADHASDIQDDGWLNLSVTKTMPTTINSSPFKGTRFTFRQSSSNPVISDDFAITLLTIKEVQA